MRNEAWCWWKSPTERNGSWQNSSTLVPNSTQLEIARMLVTVENSVHAFFYSDQPHGTMVWKLGKVTELKTFQLTDKLMSPLHTFQSFPFCSRRPLAAPCVHSRHYPDHFFFHTPRTDCAAASRVITPPWTAEGPRDKPETYFPGSAERPCRYHKNAAGPMLMKKSKASESHSCDSAEDQLSWPSHICCRYNSGPLSEAPHKRDASHEPETGI